ncbi:hypothetical protein ABL78_6025 [Leptomonas seymouri]|uniref:Uncharacterized protein n=1 Tax=Leptomonas seymouri TaxID=5684 RepID=A0A0N1PBA0_LEPSE|nr:hypothetical protein ABL78_6025 [Leptomonas seymouri]|eukprot:KPI84933.1 hypothetical protein ABL78_6025 [Leptomonas seymouri]
MFYSYAEKQGGGFFGSWQIRQVAFDTTRRYLHYSEPTRDMFPIAHSDASLSVTAAVDENNNSTTTASSPSSSVTNRRSSAAAPGTAIDSVCSPSALVWKKKMKVTAVVPIAVRAGFAHRSVDERDLYQLEIRGESRPLATGEYPPAGPLLCPSAGLSALERARCNASNEAYIRDPFFLKELFDALRDQFEEMTKAKVRAAASAAEGGRSDEGRAEPIDFGMQTLVSPRRQKTETGVHEAIVPVRVVLRCRDEREFRRLWYVVQTVLGYDKLIVRPYRGLPPYDPRNGVAFAHIPMAVWHIFKALDKAVFYTFMRGNFYVLEGSSDAVSDGGGVRSRGPAVPRLKRVLEGAYLCITHDSVLCMRESGNIPRWLRLAEVQEFHWGVVSKDGGGAKVTPFCVFLSDAPIPDLFFEPTAPVFGADAIAAYDPIVDVSRIARVIHDTCFASFSARRVIRIKSVQDASLEAYVARTLREGNRLPGLQTGDVYNSTLSCPLPKEQLAVVWQQVQSELLERGNMANRAAIPIYRTNARDVELSEDQLSAVERELDEERERRDDVVGMPLERARQLERRRLAAVESANARHTRSRHRDVNADIDDGPRASASAADQLPNSSLSRSGNRAAVSTTPTATQVMPLTMELLQTPQLQGRFAATVTQPQQGGGARSAVGSRGEQSSRSSPDESTAAASEYSGYLVRGARYLTLEEWQNSGYGSPSSPRSAAPGAASIAAGAAPVFPVPSVAAPGASGGNPAPSPPLSCRESDASDADSGRGSGQGLERITDAPERGEARYGITEERTVNEIVGHSMAALGCSRTDHNLTDDKK